MKTIILIFILFTNCKKEQDKSIAISVEKDVLSTKAIENESEIPNEIKTYIDSNSDFEMLAEKDLKLVKEQVQSSSILTYMKGDFYPSFFLFLLERLWGFFTVWRWWLFSRNKPQKQL